MVFAKKLSLWGSTHAAAREAERAAAQHGGERSDELRVEAQTLRERADSLHREVYMELGARLKSDRAAGNS